MLSVASVLVYRGAAIEPSVLRTRMAELFGGHLRPDASLLVSASAPVRVDRSADRSRDRLAGTVRVLDFATPEDCDALFTDLSHLVLAPRHGFGDHADAALQHFRELALDPLALALSQRSGPIATLYVREGGSPLGAYSLFAGGRRLWSSIYRPAVSYATWDGRELVASEMQAGDPSPPEGDHTDFPAHGLQLLFGRSLPLTHAERFALLPSLRKASRPPTQAATARLLVRDGRMTALEDEDGVDLERFTRSFFG